MSASERAVNRDGADTESYVVRDERKRDIDTSISPRMLMKDSLTAEAPAPVEDDRPATKPEITPAIIEDNYRRVAAGARNTLVTIHTDGTRSYKQDIVVRDSDGIRDTLGTDRGKGTTDSLKLLREEGKVRVEGLLDKGGRDTSGRFVKRSA